MVNSRSDLIVVHDGGGTVRFSGGQLANGASTNEGNWLYVRKLVGTPLYDVQGAMDVDMPKYAAGYAKISWTPMTHCWPKILTWSAWTTTKKTRSNRKVQSQRVSLEGMPCWRWTSSSISCAVNMLGMLFGAKPISSTEAFMRRAFDGLLWVCPCRFTQLLPG